MPDVARSGSSRNRSVFTSLNASVEFEYLYVDKEISVDKILNKTKRKKVEKFETESMEIFAPINSWHLDNMKNRQLKVTDYSSGVAGQPDRRYVMIYSGDRKIILSQRGHGKSASVCCAQKSIFRLTQSFNSVTLASNELSVVYLLAVFIELTVKIRRRREDGSDYWRRHYL